MLQACESEPALVSNVGLREQVGSVHCRLDGVMYDAEAAQQLEATVAEEKGHVQRCKEKVNDLASHLAGDASVLKQP